mmetsp:Transcript_107786/g.347949  ORF Transcript_107786/g.347949 Transcript_107786/m.347949 type:complete len:224 (-) Transcript_107786:437-1108(-)
MGMPLVLRPKTLPMEMFQPKCQPSAKPRRPPVNMTLSPAATPPTKMFSMLRSLEPPGDRRCIATKKPDSVSTASTKARAGASCKWALKASTRLCSIQPRSGSSSLRATFRWKKTSQKMQTAKLSDLSKTSKTPRKRIQPASNSTAKMKKTTATPTPSPRAQSTGRCPSSASPREARDLRSIQPAVHQTTRKDAMFIPARTTASLQRCFPVTWFRKKGCPGREA